MIIFLKKKVLESQPEDALAKLVLVVSVVFTVSTVSTVLTILAVLIAPVVFIQPACFGAGCYIEMATSYH